VYTSFNLRLTSEHLRCVQHLDKSKQDTDTHTSLFTIAPSLSHGQLTSYNEILISMPFMKTLNTGTGKVVYMVNLEKSYVLTKTVLW
jgi:hypothetical protein